MHKDFPRLGRSLIFISVRFVLLTFAVAVILLPRSTCAASPDKEGEAQDIFHEYMSPYCPELLLSDCRSSGAADLRDEIRLALASGVSADSIREQLEHTYGTALRASPRASGWGLIAWLMPALSFAFALLAVGIWIGQQDEQLNRNDCTRPNITREESRTDLLEQLRDELKLDL